MVGKGLWKVGKQIGYKAMRDVKPPEAQDLKVFNPDAEAFIAIQWDNVEEKCLNIANSDDGWRLKVGPRQQGGANAKHIDGKHTSQKSGSSMWGTFARRGVNRHLKLAEEIKEFAENNEEKVALVDKLMMKEHRKAMNITVASAKDAKAVRANRLNQEDAEVDVETLHFTNRDNAKW